MQARIDQAWGQGSVALDSLTWDPTAPVFDRIEEVQARSWWSFWLTGVSVVTLLCVALLRGQQRGDLGVMGRAGSISPRFTAA